MHLEIFNGHGSSFYLMCVISVQFAGLSNNLDVTYTHIGKVIIFLTRGTF